MSRLRLVAAPAPAGIRFALAQRGWTGRAQTLPVAAWPADAEPGLALVLARLRAWQDDGLARLDGEDGVLVPHPVCAGLGDVEAARLGLPPPPDFALHIQHEDTIDQPRFALRHGWRDVGGRPVLGVERIGAWLRIGRRDHRLPRHLFELIEAVEAFQTVLPADEAARWRAWTRVQDLLPREDRPDLQADGYLRSIEILHAGAFSLQPRLGPDGFDIDPVLYRPSAAEPAGDGLDPVPAAEPEPLLPPALNEVFVNRRFRSGPVARPRYTLATGQYLVLDPDLEAALNVVRAAQLGDRATRERFARQPRAALRAALGEQLGEAALEQLFVETAAFSERVRELGLWQPPVLPWVQRKPGQWLPDDPGTWLKGGLMVGGRPVELARERVPELQAAIEAAIAAGQPAVDWPDEAGTTVAIPATPATLAALAELPGAAAPPTKAGSARRAEGDRAAQQVLLIEPNLDALDFVRAPPPRADHGAELRPTLVRTTLKPHQAAGLAWLQAAWRAGEPGVLLADDMGLGKTLQCLALLDWVRRAQQGGRRREPFLVVAPTSLLGNWQREHGLHLDQPGLGAPLRLAGAELRWLRRPGADGDPLALDLDALRRADWVLTTYETMRDHECSLAQVRFAVAVFDEAQKIKNPGSLATKAAKGLNADFVLALTGTPVENRLADLWSIADRAHEGLLGDLKSFSERYEREGTPAERLAELKARVDQPRLARPAFMLRRMKEDQLDGLPAKRVEARQQAMPAVQAAAYRTALAKARGGRRGAMLEALQGLRAVSLHPCSADPAYDDEQAFVAQSARWQLAFGMLDEIAKAGEKALIFVEAVALQPVLASLIQRRFGLAAQPMIINGGTAGDQRARRVEAFQGAPRGFDAMILGPRAAGIGLTLTAANHVIHLSRWWNPAVEDQCTDRVYRIGQARPVTVWLPQAVFPDQPERSFDLQLDRLLQRKRALSRELLAPPGDSEHDAAELYRATVGDPG